jgi:hypothetical protein
MVFEPQTLAPGPGTRAKAPFRWRPFQSALSGSRVFQASPSGGGYDFICRRRKFAFADGLSFQAQIEDLGLRCGFLG